MDPIIGATTTDPPLGAALAREQGVSGPPGKDGADGASAYDLAGGDARWGSLDAWQAAQSSAGVVQRCYSIAIGAPGQTLLPLSPPPITLSTLMLTVNGVDYRAPSALSATEVAITWTGSFALDPFDDVYVSYF